jgi:hypothetical protein
VVPQRVNAQNVVKTRVKSSLPQGVNRHGRLYRAKVTVNYQQIYVGSYETVEEAQAAYLQAKARYHEGFVEERFK